MAEDMTGAGEQELAGAEPQETGEDAFAELDALFAEDNESAREAEAKVLSQNLTGFASCFPDWDLHPPVM